MSYYPPQGSHHSVVYPSTPIPAPFPTPQLSVPQQPNVVLIPSRANSRHSHRSHHSHRSRHDDDSDYDHRHDRDHDRHHRHRSRSRRRHHHHSDRDRDRDRERRHRDRDEHKHHRSHRKRRHYSAPQMITVPPQMAAPYPGNVAVAPSHVAYPGTYPGAYPGTYYGYRPTWTERLRQFFGFAPVSPQYQYKSDTHSWGFLGRSQRPRYVDPYTGAEVDRHGRHVRRI